jgi:pimeloyl-ACP methyl ester carboxylesterase
VIRKRTAAIAGLVAAGAIVAGKVLVRRQRRGPDPASAERFDELPPEEIAPVVSSDGTLIHVRAAGDPSAPVLVFVHGFSVDMTTWHYQWKDLSSRYRCILYDQRGHGRSGKAARGDHSLQAMGRDLKAVLDAVASEGPVVLVGHSMGAMAILGFAEVHPEEFGSRVIGAVFANTTAAEVVRGAVGALGTRLVGLAPRLTRGFGSARRMRRFITTSDFAFLVTRLTNFGPNASPSMVDYVLQLSMDAPLEVWTDGVAALIEMDLRHAIRHVTVPALVVSGDLDRLTPPASALALKNALPEGRLVVLRGAGHMAPMERHEQFNDLISRFADEVFAGAPTRVKSGGNR